MPKNLFATIVASPHGVHKGPRHGFVHEGSPRPKLDQNLDWPYMRVGARH